LSPSNYKADFFVSGKEEKEETGLIYSTSLSFEERVYILEFSCFER
jgi:hypothetical protein